MIVYLTLNDAPSAIYKSQVIDVVKCLNTHSAEQVRLAGFISPRNFSKNKKTIKDELPDAIVLPMFPFLKNWKLNRFLLYWICFVYKPRAIIARSVLAAWTALEAKRKKKTAIVCYDGRGAIAAEWNEYNVVNDETLKKEISALEKKVISESDYSIAVSAQLIAHWQSAFSYASADHVIIPCTLSDHFSNVKISKNETDRLRIKNGYAPDDVLLVYSGSVAGWQSFGLLKKIFEPELRKDPKLKILFLSGKDEKIQSLMAEFPLQINCLWAQHKELVSYLMMADYGILIREQSITNKVASPVKFAEYLSCGLKVLISENLGDYSIFVEQNDCGAVISGNSPEGLKLSAVTESEKIKNVELANIYFNKYSEINTAKYQQLIRALT